MNFTDPVGSIHSHSLYEVKGKKIKLIGPLHLFRDLE